MFRFLPLILILPLFGFCQLKITKTITDTTLVVGVIKEDCFIGKFTDANCFKQNDKILNKSTSVIISGIKNCKAGYLNVEEHFYEILYKNETYFINKNNLLTYDNFYSDLENFSAEKLVLFKTHAKKEAEFIYSENLKLVINFLINCKPSGLTILDWSYYKESEYTEGTSVKIKIHNPTQKTIKYLWFTFVGFNPVKDVVIDNKQGTSKIKVKAVGPISPDENGVYEFKYVWFTDLIKTAKIESIKIQYMDNSFKIISSPKKIILPKSYFDFLFDEE